MSDGKKYVGEFLHSKKHGQGTMTYPDGSEYVGEWRDDKQHGRGAITYPDGKRYIGQFLDDKEYGHGTLTLPDGKKYVGEFLDGRFHGQGTLTSTDGTEYTGGWLDGKKHGVGKMTYPDGKIEERQWREGEFSGQSVKYDDFLGAAAPQGETVNFDKLMRTCSVVDLGDQKPYAYLDPAEADLNENGMLDADELAVLAAVIKDDQAPHHAEVRDAFKANEAKAGKDLDGFSNLLLPPLKSVMAGYIMLGDGWFHRESEQSSGSRGVFAQHFEGTADYGSVWKVGAPKKEDYTQLADIVGPCGDLDGDGVRNVSEYHAKGKVRADYLAAVADPTVKGDGGDPDGACGEAKAPLRR